MSAAAAAGPRPGAERRPRLARGLAVVRRPDALLVEGVAKRQVFTGAAATGLLPRLFALLDGEHDIAALAAATGMRGPEIGRALRLLDQGGLVEWVRPDQVGPALDPAADAYLSRGLSLNKRHDEVRTIAAVLANAEVTVLGAGPLAEAVLCCLRESGVTGAVRASAVPDDPQQLVVVCEREPAGFAAAAAELWQRGTPVLRFAGNGERLELGPFFHPRWTSCPRCWSLAGGAATDGAASGGAAAGEALPADAVELAAGLVCGEVLALLSMITPPVTVSRVVRTTLAELREEVLVLGPEPGCERCLPQAPEADALVAARYERAAAWSPWAERPSGTGKPVSRVRSQYEASPKLPLDRLPQDLRPLLTEPAATDEVDVYLLGVPELAHPVHLYDPDSGQLVATRASADPVPLGLPGEPAAVLVLVAAPVRRYADHGAQSHRLAQLQAGVALAQLQRAAGGYRLQVTTRCDPALRELLELRTDQEVPAVVVGVYREVEHATGH
ncbi:hypothetical protein OG455_22230 [Kitasatospora sp. NBC_01287]|uniref:hypothetical protein n=1 Tax=Kitasatospora sp. NBC_01287 TaxID=2903573 RepID=UPI002256D4DC|nr:hypothetical protein [Kitasatospora sp. NBC_01287]MCX4748197.1 hypothetical protein [Kitasatospora sp. NBC_01287]